MKVNFYLAEVIESTKINTYQQGGDRGCSPSELYGVMARTYAADKVEEVYCIPSNSNIKQIPLAGEHILIFQGTNSFSDANKYRNQWYYFPGFNIQSDINNNALPGVAISPVANVDPVVGPGALGSSFVPKSVSHLQAYEGDIILEGRFSNSIRLGGTVSGGNYSKQPAWEGAQSGDPIIIISNDHKDTKGKFTVEDPNDSGATIYLTSWQKLPKLQLYNQCTKSQGCTAFGKAQLVAVANRIVLSAKKDSVILDSPRRITLSTPEIRIGKESADHPLVKGDKLLPILYKILNIINAGVDCTGGVTGRSAASPEDQIEVINLCGKINSEKHFFDK